MNRKTPISDLTWAASFALQYEKHMKILAEAKEKFIMNIILPKLKWYDKLIFKVYKKWLGKIATQVVQRNDLHQERWGIRLYGIIYWLGGEVVV